MPQLLAFPVLPGPNFGGDVGRLISVCCDASSTESFTSFRSKLKEHSLYKRETADGLLAFLRIAKGGEMKSAILTKLNAAEDENARIDVMIERLWHVNPLLMSTILTALQERVFNRDELFVLVDSSAYRGNRLPRAALQSWLDLALGLQIVKKVGISLGLGANAAQLEQKLSHFDVEEFLEEDTPEPELQPVTPVGEEPTAPPAPTGEPSTPSAIEPEPTLPVQIGHSLPSPHAAETPPALPEDSSYDEAALEANRERMLSWWNALEDKPSARTAADFSIDSEQWMNDPATTLFRIAVAAALDETAPASAIAAFAAIDNAGIIENLFHGVANTSVPAGVDAQTVMLASVVMRRFSEHPDLAVEIEKQDTGEAVFTLLQDALGRGLFEQELHFIIRCLVEVGATRASGIASYGAPITRACRDTLFRLGFLDTPYAFDQADLAAAAQAAGNATEGASASVLLLDSFALAAGCQFSCQQVPKCAMNCRERLDRANR